MPDSWEKVGCSELDLEEPHLGERQVQQKCWLIRIGTRERLKWKSLLTMTTHTVLPEAQGAE